MTAMRWLHLVPSETKLYDAPFPSLWETTDGELIFGFRGVEGDCPPASPASGQVECRWSDGPMNEPMFMARGVPRGGYLEVKGVDPQERRLIVRSKEGFLEAVPVTCFERLVLDRVVSEAS